MPDYSRDKKDRRDRRSRSRSRDDRRRRSRSRDHKDRDHKASKESKAPSPEKEPEPPAELKAGSQVRIQGLQKNPEKNGSIGTLVEFNEAKGRWLVEFASGATNNFKAENLEVVMAAAAEPDDDNEEIPTPKVYISNLSADTTVADLIQLFSGLGQLAKEPVRNSKGSKEGFADQWPPACKLYRPGRPNGDGCLEYVDKFAARAAIKTYNGYKLKGNKISVAYAGQGRKYESRELTPSWVERNAGRDRSGSRDR